MGKTLQQKAKPSVKNKSLKVVLPFNKKSPTFTVPQMEQGKRKKIASPLAKAAPLHSSTPKPVQKPIPIPLTAGQPYFEKELVIILERLDDKQLKVCDTVTSPVLMQKTKIKSDEKKQKPKKERKVAKSAPQPSVKSRSKPIRGQKNQLMKDPSISECEANITTQIPSEILKNFGIPSPHSRFASPKRPPSKSSNSVLLETPPRTSTTSSSVNCVDHSVSNTASLSSLSEDEMFLPDSPLHQVTSTNSQLGLSLQPNLVLSNILEQDGTPVANVSTSSLVDPLETLSPKSCPTVVQHGTLSTHCESLYGLAERVYLKPDIYSLDELSFGNPDIRLIAPYGLRVHPEDDEFFLYAAPVSRTFDKYCCLVLGVLKQHIIAYGGYFMVFKNRLYDPVKKIPVEDVKLTNPLLCRQLLCLLNIPNKMLVEMEDYIPQAFHPSHQDTLLASLDVFVGSIDQVRIKEKVLKEIVQEQTESKIRAFSMSTEGVTQFNGFKNCNQVTTNLCEPRMEQVFSETCLSITVDSFNRVMDSLDSLHPLKPRQGELASLLQNCATQREFYSLYYAAHEAPGCMCFYKNVFVLGHVGSHYVVGVLEGTDFFIMATKRLYSRYCVLSPGMQPVEYSPEMLETIHLPLWISFEHTLTILEARQILRHPYKYHDMYKEFVRALGILESRSPSTSVLTYPELESRLEFDTWLEKMLEENFTAGFRHSLCQFPTHPTSCNSPLLFVENVTKLWVHQLMRRISDIEDANVEANTLPIELSVLELFTLDTSTFISHFLPMFGMSDDFNFQCLRLGTDGLPTGVCLESLPARQIGLHVHQCHTLPLFRDKDDSPKNENFVPFTLVFQKNLNPPLSEANCDFHTLSWIRFHVERWSRGASESYLKLLKVIGNLDTSPSEQKFPNSEGAKQQLNKVVGGQKKKTRKRRHTSGEETSRNFKRHHLQS